MADEAEDVLELDEEQIVEEPEGDDADETEGQAEDEAVETYFGFDGDEDEGAAPAPEGDSSVIRELRKQNRALNAEVKALKAGKQPEQIVVGEKPTLESCDYDEPRYESELDAWKERKAKAARLEQERNEEREAEEARWKVINQTYETDKASLNIADFDGIEEEIASVLPESHRALLLKSGKGAALVAALHRSPTTLSELSKLDPVDAAMMIGELRSKLKMKTRSRPAPDRPVKGNAASTTADKELSRLEKEAARTGDRTALIRYKRQLSTKA